MANKHIIAQEFMIHEAILKRQAVLGHLAEGLRSLGFLDVMQKIPSFEQLLVYENQLLDAEKVISCLNNLTPEKEAAVKMLKFITESSDFKYIQCNTSLL